MAPVPLGQYLAERGALPQSRPSAPPATRTLAAGAPSRPSPPRASGPDVGAQVAGRALSLLPRSLQFATSPDPVSGASLGLSLAGSGLALVDEPGAKIAGRTLSFAAPLAVAGAAEAGLLGTSAAAQAAAAGLPAAGILAGWGAPGFVAGLHSLIEGNEAEVRRSKRTQVAGSLGHQIATPVQAASDPLALDAAFQTAVGESTAGDALAAMLKYNLEGTWFADTSHGWLPDPSLLPLQRYLAARGYTGQSEPTRGDVGGVGEIVAGSGHAFVPRSFVAAAEQADFDEWVKSGSETFTPKQTTGGYWGAPFGALGWETVLRTLTGRITGQPITGPSRVLPPTATGDYGHIELTPDGYGGTLRTLVPPDPMTDYFEELRAVDPSVADRVERALAARRDSEAAVHWEYTQGAP